MLTIVQYENLKKQFVKETPVATNSEHTIIIQTQNLDTTVFIHYLHFIYLFNVIYLIYFISM